LQPEQEAQQSSEAQHPACAAVAALANPSVITAINSITFNVFMIRLLFFDRKSCSETDGIIRTRKNFAGGFLSKCGERALAGERLCPIARVWAERFDRRKKNRQKD
jgi:hypothetical protein